MRFPERVGPTTSASHPIRWLILALIAGAAGCGSDPTEVEWSTLSAAERLWSEHGPGTYDYVYTSVCFCPYTPRRVSVSGGEVVAVEPIPPAEPPSEPLEGYTTEELFDRIRQELARDPHEHRLEFHPTLGYPLEAWFDYEENTVDEEWGFRVTELRTPH